MFPVILRVYICLSDDISWVLTIISLVDWVPLFIHDSLKIKNMWKLWRHYGLNIWNVSTAEKSVKRFQRNINGNIDQICPDGAIFIQSNQHWRQFIGHEDFCNQNIYLGTFTCWMSFWSVLLISKHLSPSWVNAEQWADRSSRSVESLESDTISGATWD